MTRPTADLVAILGCGALGSALAGLLVTRGTLSPQALLLVDAQPGRATALADDLADLSAGLGSCARVSAAGSRFALLDTAGLVVCCAGYPPSPGVPPARLAEVNGALGVLLGREIAAHAPDALVLVATSPSLSVAAALSKAAGLAPRRVLACGPAVDLLRVRGALARALSVAPGLIEIEAMGGEGEGLAVPRAGLLVGGEPLAGRLAEEQLEDLVLAALRFEGRAAAGAEGPAASYGAAAALNDLIEALVRGPARERVVGVELTGELSLGGGFGSLPLRLAPPGAVALADLRPCGGGLEALRRSAEGTRAPSTSSVVPWGARRAPTPSAHASEGTR